MAASVEEDGCQHLHHCQAAAVSCTTCASREEMSFSEDWREEVEEAGRIEDPLLCLMGEQQRHRILDEYFIYFHCE